jgi:hypothetical protein
MPEHPCRGRIDEYDVTVHIQATKAVAGGV